MIRFLVERFGALLCLNWDSQVSCETVLVASAAQLARPLALDFASVVFQWFRPLGPPSLNVLRCTHCPMVQLSNWSNCLTVQFSNPLNQGCGAGGAEHAAQQHLARVSRLAAEARVGVEKDAPRCSAWRLHGEQETHQVHPRG